MRNKGELTQSVENQNWWDHVSGTIGDGILDAIGFFLPSVSNNIKDAIREEDIETLSKALSNANEQLAAQVYNHNPDPKIQKTIDKINGIVNSLSQSAPSNYKVHFKVLRKENQTLKNLQDRDEEKRVKNEAANEIKRAEIQGDIDTLSNYAINPDNAYSSGASVKRDFAKVVDKYI